MYVRVIYIRRPYIRWIRWNRKRKRKKKKRKEKKKMKKKVEKRRPSSVSWVYSKTRHLPALKSHQPSRYPFHLPPPVISTPSRLSLLFYLFRLSTPFWKLAQISRQFTLCALRRFPPSRFHPGWRSHPNGSRYRFIRLRPPSHPYDVLMGLTPGPRCTCTYRNPATCGGSFYRWATPGVLKLFCTYFALIHPSRPLTRPPPHPSPYHRIHGEPVSFFFFSRAVKQFSLSG